MEVDAFGMCDWGDKGSHMYPFRMFIIACFHEGLAYVEVFALNNAIGLGVIRGNLYVMDAIFI